jgi:hypothetical protein
MKTLAIHVFGGLAAWALLTAPARADIIINTFGPGDSYQPFLGQGVGLPNYQDVANRFTPTNESFTLDRLVLALSVIRGTDGVDVWLTNTVGGVPGTILESWHVDNLPRFGSNNMPTDLESVVHPFLEEGVPYWVVATVPIGENTSAVWNINVSGDADALGIRQNNGSWFVINDVLGRGAFRVEATLAPEPGTLALFGLGTLGLLGYAWRRRRQLA